MYNIPDYEINIPDDLISSWQETINISAEFAEVPSALIMGVKIPHISVFLSSETKGNPYEKEK